MYLIRNDYLRQIQPSQLAALSSSNNSVIIELELAAQDFVKSYLSKKFDLSMEFTDTVQWDFTTSYKGLRRVYLDAVAYSAVALYALNALTLQSGNVYRCTTAITVAEAFTLAHWTLLGAQYSIFYVLTNNPVWDGQTYFKTGDKVWWKDKDYTCVNNNVAIEPGATESSSSWGTGVAFSLASGTLPTDATKWSNTDNRGKHFILIMLHLVIYWLSKRIATNNVPQMYIDDYDSSVAWLLSASGKDDAVDAQLPRLQPKQWYRSLMKGDKRNVNNY